MSDVAVGLMSGTSVNGVDAALVQIDSRDSVELLSFHIDPYSPAERRAVLESIHGGTARDIALLNVVLGERFAAAAAAILERVGLEPDELSFVASHGQTVWHEAGRATLQLGDPAIIAERLGVRVVSDFRSRDIAAGGQGAPLVPAADVFLFGHPEHPRILLNLGGIANATWVRRRGYGDDVTAFDAGPAGALIDAVVRRVDPAVAYDDGGKRAKRGTAVEEVVGELLEHAYFDAPPPKSTGRELFGEDAGARLIELVSDRHPDATGDDCIATAVRFVSTAVAGQLRRWLPDERGCDVLVSGGGAHNDTLIAELLAALPGRNIQLFEREFFSGDAKEAVAFALLGWLTLEGQPGNVHSATGAQGPRVLGRITPA